MESDSQLALIVDFGGVLTTSIWPAFSAFCEGEGLDPGAVRELFRNDPRALADLRELETGACEPEEFEVRFAGHLGIPDRAEGLIGRLFGGLEPDEGMIAAVRAAREAGIPTGLISNSWGRTIYDDELIDSIFDAVVISGDVGLHKPEPEIYLLACERLGVEPADAVFVDDLRENCEGAEAVGMTALLHRDTGATVAALGELLGIALPHSQASASPQDSASAQ
jgi:epoxide hydrolase-like predicted phosphatase